MTHGTITQDSVEIAGDDSGTGGGGRIAVRIAATALAVALSAAGVYAVIGGSPEANAIGIRPATAAGADSAVGTAGSKQVASAAETAAAAKKAAAKKAAAKKAAAKAAAAKAALLPPAAAMTAAQKRAGLVTYLEAGAFPLSARSSPATAASNACVLLDGGMTRAKLVRELSRGAGVSVTQGRYFLTGATHFYCAKHSSAA